MMTNMIYGQDYPNTVMDTVYTSFDVLIENILYKCEDFGGNNLVKLEDVLITVLKDYEISYDESMKDIDWEEENNHLLNKFIEAKSLEGCSPRTIKYYQDTMVKFLEFLCKSLQEINSDDIREYLKHKMTRDNVSNATADNHLRILRSCFKWLSDEGYIYNNPTNAIPKIKSPKILKKPFTYDEIETLRSHFQNKKTQEIIRVRNIAIFELLLSSGIRINELVQLNRKDIDWRHRSFIVMGKGFKERKCYFNVKTKKCLKEYLELRDDDSNALFASKRGGRLKDNGIERLMREAGREHNIKCHPHKFRRTFATDLLRKNVPLEQVQKLLGHDSMETTTLYAIVDDEMVQFNHKRLMD